MKYLEMYLWPFIIAQLASILLLWAAYAAPRLARLLFFFLFAWAFGINLKTAIQDPEAYLDYAPMALPFYADFINGWFKDHITVMVSCIAAGQAMIAAGMLLKGIWVKLACAGAILFLLAIAPLGVGAGFPFSVTVSLALYFVLRNNPQPDYLWHTPYKKPLYRS